MSFRLAGNSFGKASLVVADDPTEGAAAKTAPKTRTAVQSIFRGRKTIGYLLGQGTSLRLAIRP
jgi:hypothetical protein